MRLVLAAMQLCACAVGMAAGQDSSALPRSTPEAQGISPAAILDFVRSADRQVDAMHSFIQVRHGFVVTKDWRSPYAANVPHSLYSLSKSFASTAGRLAIAEGKLSLDEPALTFFPDEAPAAPGENLKAMRLRDLLTMNTGPTKQPQLTGSPVIR